MSTPQAKLNKVYLAFDAIVDLEKELDNGLTNAMKEVLMQLRALESELKEKIES